MEDCKEEELSIAGKDFLKLKSSHKKSGYRDGATEGHQYGIQESFEQGFINGGEDRVTLGRLLGCLNALKAHKELKGEDVSNIKELIKEGEAHRLRKSSISNRPVDNAQTLETILQEVDIANYKPLQELQAKCKSLLTNTT